MNNKLKFKIGRIANVVNVNEAIEWVKNIIENVKSKEGRK